MDVPALGDRSSSEQAELLSCVVELAPANWRLAYEWMNQRLTDLANRTLSNPPIWCWHSCNGTLGSAPTVATAVLLLSSYQIEQGMVTIELDVPVELALLSSYHRWNEFLDFVITKQRLPKSRRLLQQMFAEPLLKDEHDDIQAVIPFIDPAWVRGVADLSVEGRDWDAPIFPGQLR